MLTAGERRRRRMAALPRCHAAGGRSTAAAGWHIAIIMDGNGRWAASRGLPRVAGHRAGAQAVRRTVESAIRHGVGWITLYAFSSENWRRPPGEVLDLTGLLRHYLRNEMRELTERRAPAVHRRPRPLRRRYRGRPGPGRAATAGNTRLNLTLALSYGARAEIAAAARAAARAVRQGRLDPDAIDEASFSALLSTAACRTRI